MPDQWRLVRLMFWDMEVVEDIADRSSDGDAEEQRCGCQLSRHVYSSIQPPRTSRRHLVTCTTLVSDMVRVSAERFVASSLVLGLTPLSHQFHVHQEMFKDWPCRYYHLKYYRRNLREPLEKRPASRTKSHLLGDVKDTCWVDCLGPITRIPRLKSNNHTIKTNSHDPTLHYEEFSPTSNYCTCSSPSRNRRDGAACR